MKWTAIGWAVVIALAAIGCRTRQARDGAVPVASAPSTPAAVLRVATSGDYAPFSIVNADGELTGMDVEIAERLASDLGMQLALTRFTWPELDAAVERGELDIAMGGITMRADRALVGRFTRPDAQTGAMALIRVRDAARFSSVDALDRPDVRIAVNAGGHLERLARQRFPRATIEPLAANRAVAARLRDGDADAAISDSAEVRTWLGPGLIAIGPFTHDDKAYLLPAGSAELAARIDAWLAAREADGWLNAQRLRWIGPDAGCDPADAARNAVVAFVDLRLQLAPAIAAAKQAASLPIEDPQQEARVLERVRDAAGEHGERAIAVYRVLIELSKTVQRSGTPGDLPAQLPQLRDALARIDAALVPALGGAPPTPSAVWNEILATQLTDARLTAAQLAPLADALSAQ